MRPGTIRKLAALALLAALVVAGSMAGGYLFQSTSSGTQVLAQESAPAPQGAPPSLAALAESVRGAVVAIGTKAKDRGRPTAGQLPFGPEQWPFFGPPFGDEGSDPFQQFFERFFGPNVPFNRFRMQGDSDGSITMRTPQGTYKLYKDDEGQWWIEDEKGKKEKWEGNPFFERFYDKGGGKQAPRSIAEEFPSDFPTTVGSGVLISEDGYVVTNSHVANALPKDDLWVVLNDDEAVEATLVGNDDETDVAVLKIEVGRPLPYSPFGDSEAVKVGDWLMAVGHPFGLEHTFTVGILSARGRNLGKTYDGYLQTDAVIHPGNSGGPLYNMAGEIVGINTAIATSSPLTPMGQGIGFAIPSNQVQRVANDLMASGEIVRGYIGVSLLRGQHEARNRPYEYGALIAEVRPDHAAAKAGLQKGDVVIAFDGKRVNNGDDLVRFTERARPGDRVKVEYVRNGQAGETTIVIEKRPPLKELMSEQ